MDVDWDMIIIAALAEQDKFYQLIANDTSKLAKNRFNKTEINRTTIFFQIKHCSRQYTWPLI